VEIERGCDQGFGQGASGIDTKDAEGAEGLANKPLDFDQELLRYENALIKRALHQADVSLTRAAASLRMSYQKLARIMETRHKDLLAERTLIRRRSRKE
jgi:DNA-binding NtrC family response regulator